MDQGKEHKAGITAAKSSLEKGFRYRIHYKLNKIRPDIRSVCGKVALFVDGCQWHGCPEHYVHPRSNQVFWDEKLKNNVERDISQTRALRETGWIPLRIWEHEIWADMAGVVDIVTTLLVTGREPDRENWRVVDVKTIDSENDIERRRAVKLDSPLIEQIVERKRSTKKWNRSIHLQPQDG